jgi:hypothetical protein
MYLKLNMAKQIPENHRKNTYISQELSLWLIQVMKAG